MGFSRSFSVLRERSVPAPPPASKEDTRPIPEEFACSSPTESIYSKGRSISSECSHTPQRTRKMNPVCDLSFSSHHLSRECQSAERPTHLISRCAKFAKRLRTISIFMGRSLFPLQFL